MMITMQEIVNLLKIWYALNLCRCHSNSCRIPLWNGDSMPLYNKLSECVNNNVSVCNCLFVRLSQLIAVLKLVMETHRLYFGITMMLFCIVIFVTHRHFQQELFLIICVYTFSDENHKTLFTKVCYNKWWQLFRYI